MKFSLVKWSFLIFLFVIAIVYLPVCAQSTAEQPKSTPPPGLIAVCGPSSKSLDSASGPPCKVEIPPIELVTASQLYSAVGDAITLFRDGKYGFPADVIGVSYGLPYAKWSLSPKPLLFRKRQLQEQLQSVKQLKPGPQKLPAVVPISIAGHNQPLYPANYVRALFLTELFPSKVKLVESWPAQRSKGDKALYVILETSRVAAANASLKALANAQHKSDSGSTTPLQAGRESGRATVQLLRTALPVSQTETRTGPDDPCVYHAGTSGIAAWLPCVSVGDYMVRISIANDWRCGFWTDNILYVKDQGTAIDDRLKQRVDRDQGCVLELSVHTPFHAGDLLASVKVAMHLEVAYAAAPNEFGDLVQAGLCRISSAYADPVWHLALDEPADTSQPSEPAILQIAVPRFTSAQARPKIVLGLSAVVRATVPWSPDPKCWCSPNVCTQPEQETCKKALTTP